jgi:hypothetical protein
VYGLFFTLVSSACSFAQSDTQTLKISSPIAPLNQSIFGPALAKGSSWTDANGPKLNEPYYSGVLSEEAFRTKVLPALTASAQAAYNSDQPHVAAPKTPAVLTIDTTRTTIIHLMRWKDTAHTAIAFEKWYLYDPKASKTSFYVQTSAQIFQRTAIAGEQNLQLLYIHINSDLTDPSEGISPGGGAPSLTNPVNYTVTITKEKSQLVQDIKSVATLVGWLSGAAAAAAVTNLDDATSVYGYWSASTFQSEFPTSQIVVSASINGKNSPGAPQTDSTGKPVKDAAGDQKPTTTTSQLSSKTYNSEKPAYFELGFAIPVTSYKDITYSSTSSTVTPTSATQQSAVLVGNLYLPPAQPGLTSFRYIPHLLFGLPIKGKVLQHTMLGAGIGLDWLSPYAGIIFDTNYGATTGTNAKPGHLVLKGTYGIEISVSSAVSLLKGK